MDTEIVRSLERRLGTGESQAIALAVELRADAVLIDDWEGRLAASRLGLTPIGALGILVRARKAGLIGAVRPLVQRLIAEMNFRVSDQVLGDIFKQAGE